ncbi:hypothetical protein [Sulfurimonas sp.]|uniref:hypothetical protein n=1 Tax=Sulfurimonas sp. TaxID=2022749 RepID=UPI003D0A4D93
MAKKLTKIDISKVEVDPSLFRTIRPIDPRIIRGVFPIPQFILPIERLREIAKGQVRYVLKSAPVKASKGKIIEGIEGGIRRAHLHLDDEIVLLDKKALQSYLKLAAKELDKIKDINQIETFIQM